jgi:mannosyltransferase OCH1-like enzyme
MGSWQKLNPDFVYRVWGEKEIDELRLRNRDVYERYVADRIFDGAADVARVEILHRFGGIYVDADSLALRPLRDAEFLAADFAAVGEPSEDQAGLISNAFMGAVAEHPILERYIEVITSVVDLRPMWHLTGPGALTDVLKGFDQPGVVILPAWMFFSTTLDGEEVAGGDPYGRHFWSTTAERWGRPGGTAYPIRQG